MECDASVAPPVVSASASVSDSATVTLGVPADVVTAFSDYQAQCKADGRSWRRLVIDCHADGRLSMQTDPSVPGPGRWPTRVLAAIAVVCSVAAVVVFAWGWQSPQMPPLPPRAAMIEVPAPSAREQQAFDVVRRWYDAEARADGAAMRALACAKPGKNVEDEIEGFEQSKTVEAIVFLEAVVGFRDEGDRVWGRFLYRAHPVSERNKRLVEKMQQEGGYFGDGYTLVVEDGQLKVCDSDTPPRV